MRLRQYLPILLGIVSAVFIFAGARHSRRLLIIAIAFIAFELLLTQLRKA